MVSKEPINILIANPKEHEVSQLSTFLTRYDKNIKILNRFSSASEFQHFLDQPNEIDLVFMNTKLSDGSAFDLLSKITIENPVVFTSSTKKEAFEAFQANGIDYLLEPIQYIDVVKALEKVRDRRQRCNEKSDIEAKKMKQRFLVKIGDKLKYKNTEDISYIFAEGKVVYIVSKQDGRKYIIDHTLDELEKSLLNQDDYFRINRKFIIHIDAIDEIRNYVNSRLKIILNLPTENDMIVSREKVQEFKNWLNL